MTKKKKIHLFFRILFRSTNFSVENWYLELIKKFKSKDIEFKIKTCPFESKNILNRTLNIIWAFFNQGDVNHITGDINFNSLLYEGFGMPIIEAQAVGRPVITSNLNPMNFVGGNAVLYVKPRSDKSIRNGIIKLISKKNLRDKLINNGFKNIKRFNKNEILQKLLNCYYNILNNRIKN